MKTITNTSNKWTQKGLDVIINNNNATITSGKLILSNGTAELKQKEDFLLTDEIDTIALVIDLATNETMVALIDNHARLDNQNYKMIERLAWKDIFGVWNKLKIVPNNNQPKSTYNYEGLNAEGIKKGITIQPNGRISQK